MTKILITGGTGLIGQQLSKKLQEKNYEIAILSRNPKEKNEYKWDVSESYIDKKALQNTQYIIHLAGASIADKRWSEKQKQIIMDSRVKTANLLFEKVKEESLPIKKIISASGIGYYGAITNDKIFTEEDKPHTDFIAKVCVEWEKSIQKFSELNIPYTILRTGVVLAKKDSALQKINTPVFLSALGSGKQYFPWIHIDDLCDLYIQAIMQEDMNGMYNAVAPDFQTNASFTKELGKVIQKPITPINVPSFVMRMSFGEMSKILLEGSRVSAEKIEKYYNFTYKDVNTALQNIYEK